MPYCTQADLIERFGEDELLAIARDETGTAIDAAVVERACDDASGEIDGYVSAAGYPVPLSPVPRIVTAYACDIARYRLYDEHATDQVQKRYDDAVKFLKSVSRGEVRLGISSGAASSSAGSVQMNSGRQVFNGGGF
ncbi:gp436 family protein [Vreelandella venusta]|uniref:gp436 family protein n=1 Tax=Vreelandella venusta TaxID=44935 RepID=UPI003F669FB9